jgi:hypothetical protein
MPEQPRGSASVHQSNLHRFGTNFLTLPPIGCYRALNQIGKTRNSYRRGQQLAPGQHELINGFAEVRLKLSSFVWVCPIALWQSFINQLHP